MILSGEVNVFISGCELKLKAGEGYFAGSGILHSAELRSTKGWQHCMVFDPHVIAAPDDIVWNTYVAPILSHDNLPFVKLSPNIPWQKEILTLAEKAWSSGAYEKTDYPLTVRSSLTKIKSLLVKNIASEIEHPFTSKTQRDELITNPTLSIADIASSCGFNDISYFNRCFLKAYGKTPTEYRNNFGSI